MHTAGSVPRVVNERPSTPPTKVAAIGNPASPALLSPSISVGFHDRNSSHLLASPPPVAFQSPWRQHRRTPSQHREVKETLNARSEYADDDNDGYSHHKINQYTLKKMIGQGSYGSVHVATDQYGQEYAIKEFSKARLRRFARTNMMRQGPFRAGRFPGSPGGPTSLSGRIDHEAQAEAKDALHLIREEIAVMKKLNHPNLVQLIEVLDDPEEDSLYMVLEMCSKGVIMDVGLGKTAKPYSAEECRCWFRDLILGIEYLHSQNILHRDIKPDNLLITEDDVLKIGDFGVSEMFARPDGMRTSKTAGSPAFLPPELCVSHHGDVAGTACDIWSMGVTLYCLRYGKIPFEQASVPAIYDAINNSEAELPADEDQAFVDLIHRILEKDPNKRIKMAELREHAWITKEGNDPLLSAEENCSDEIEPPNALELNHAFTRNMGHLLCVMKAIGKFKSLIHSRTNTPRVADFTDSASRLSSTLTPSDEDAGMDAEVARLVEERRNNIRKASQEAGMLFISADEDTADASAPANLQDNAGNEVQKTPLLLGIGTGGTNDFSSEGQQTTAGVVSESPTTADFNVYDRAFQSEVRRIRTHHNRHAVFLNKVLEREGVAVEDLTARDSPLDNTPDAEDDNSDSVIGSAGPAGPDAATTVSEPSLTLADVVARAMESKKS